MTIQGVELHLDIFDADTAEAFETQLERVRQAAEASAAMKPSQAIRAQCQAVYDCFDALFGEDARREIFGETVNLRECLSAFGALVQGASAQRDEVTQLMAQYAPQRVARA